MTRPTVAVLPDPAAVADEAAKRVEAAAAEALAASGRFVLVLAGGGTPRALYERLASPHHRGRVPWRKTVILFGDERCVPPDDFASNYRMADETLLRHVAVPSGSIHRIRGEDPDRERAAREYDGVLRRLFPAAEAPRFDLVLLGMGADGHTASLFPRSAALEESARWVVPSDAPVAPVPRITLTLPALAGARHVLFLITGAEKARAAAEAFGGLPHPVPLPCERVSPLSGTATVLLDEWGHSAFSSNSPFQKIPPKRS